MSPHRRSASLRRARAGMTILEISVAITVLLVMSLIVYESLSSSIEFNELLSKRDGTTRSARATLSTLRRELQLAYLTPARTALETAETVFVGMDEEPDKLYFATLAHQRLYMDSRECDQSEVTVWAESSPRDVGEGYIIYHRESPRVDHEPGQGGHVYPLAYNVRSFNVRYLDPQTNEWRDEWDSRNADTFYRIPRAVEIGLVLIAPDPEDSEETVDVPFLSRFTLVYGQRLMQSFVGLGQLASGTDGTAPAQPTNTQPLPFLGGGQPFQNFQGNTPSNSGTRTGTNRGRQQSTPMQGARNPAMLKPTGPPVNGGGK